MMTKIKIIVGFALLTNFTLAYGVEPEIYNVSKFNRAFQFNKVLLGTDVRVISDIEGTTLKIPADNAFNSCGEIDACYYRILNKVVVILKNCPSKKIIIRGYSDDVGTSKEQKLRSAQQARKIAEYLTNAGINPLRIREVSGQGNRWPMTDNGIIAGKAYNRRVEITLK